MNIKIDNADIIDLISLLKNLFTGIRFIMSEDMNITKLLPVIPTINALRDHFPNPKKICHAFDQPQTTITRIILMVLHLSRERSDVLDISNLTKKSMGSQAIRKDKFGSFMTGEVCFKCF